MSVPLLMVDGHNLIYRAALGTPASIPSRDPVNPRDLTGVFFFFALLRKTVNEEFGLRPGQWPEVLVVFDGEHGSQARKDVDPGYKANRPAAADLPRNPIDSLPDVRAGLDALGMAWAEVEDAEADDLIASYAAAAAEREVLILSTDRDFLQLLRDAGPGRGPVGVINPLRRTGPQRLGPGEVLKEFGVAPERFADLRALSGDASDRIPGVHGVGLKTASALLTGGIGLEELAAGDRLSGVRGEAVKAAWPQVLAWRSMIRMRLDVALPVVPSGARTRPMPPAGAVLDRLGLWQCPAPVTPVPAQRTGLAAHAARGGRPDATGRTIGDH